MLSYITFIFQNPSFHRLLFIPQASKDKVALLLSLTQIASLLLFNAGSQMIWTKSYPNELRVWTVMELAVNEDHYIIAMELRKGLANHHSAKNVAKTYASYLEDYLATKLTDNKEIRRLYRYIL